MAWYWIALLVAAGFALGLLAGVVYLMRALLKGWRLW